MTDTPSRRRLAAVWFADIVGYTGISARDDRAAMALVSLLQQCARRAVGARDGRLVKFLGDGAMAEFGSTDDAVRAALALRAEFEARAARQIVPALLRIGVHAGEVIVSEDDIYGDGVNVASRIQREARPGQILVSADVWRQLGPRREFVTEDIGERELRGTTEPYRLYAVDAAPEEPTIDSVDPDIPEAWAIAVLPFVDISPDRDNEYLSEGITEELIYSLGRVEGLRVASRTSSYAFKERSAAIPEIAEALGVNVVLEGSVRKWGNRVRVTPLLVDAGSGYQIWTESYERDLEDVFDLQETFSADIVDALQMNLGAPRRITREHTRVPAAYEEYLKGRYHWNRHSPQDFRLSIEHYERAIAADPDYALAWAGLADTYITLGGVFLQRPDEVYPRARDAARKALDLDPQLASAQAALAEVQMRYEWDFDAAERAFRRALALDPDNAEARGRYANLLRDMGRFDEAIVEVRRAQGMDPHSLPVAAAAAGVFYYARRYDDAIEVCQRALELEPRFYNANYYLASAHLQKGRTEEAVRHFERVSELAGVPDAVAVLAVAFAAAGRTEEARSILADLMAMAGRGEVSAYPVASACVALGEFDEAYPWFDRAIEERTSWMTSLRVEPRFDRLHGDPRFKKLLARIGFPGLEQAVPHNLPAQPTSIVGRDREIAALEAMVVDPGTRLVTLVGPGGVGKTRLSVEVAGRVLDHFPDGAWFVSLSAIDHPELLLPTIARTLGLQAVGADVHDHLVVALRDHRALLVLDGFEHLLSVTSAVAELMAAIPEVHLIVTSQSTLRIRGERVFSVPPLELPAVEVSSRVPAQLARYGAVALFLERMEEVRPGVQPDQEDLEAIVGICHQTDGLPLAIELAAARLRLMSPPALLARLQDRFAFLIEGPRDLPERHRTLRAVCDWSYGLLDAREQATFRRLSVFVGGCGLDAAEWMLNDKREASDGGYGAADRRSSLDLLASLGEKSLVRQVETGEGEPRFQMLETIRQYGMELLTDLGEMTAVRSRQIEFFTNLAGRAEPSMTGPDQAVWLDRLEREHANVADVIDWALAGGLIEPAVRLGSSMWWFWWLRGHFAEMRKRLETALQQGADLPRALRANLLVASGSLATLDGDMDRAAAFYEQAVALERGRSERRGRPRVLRNYASGLASLGEYERAISLYEEALSMAREFSDPVGESDALRGLGRMALCLGDLEAAERRYDAALSTARDIGASQLVAYALAGLGDVALESERWEEAEAFYEEALAACREIDSRPGVTSALQDLAEVARLSGRRERAVELHRQAIEIARRLDDQRRIGRSLAGLGACAVQNGEVERGAMLLGAAEGISGLSGALLPPHERRRWESILESAVETLAAPRLEQVLEEGRGLSLSDALDRATGGTPGES